MAASIESGTLRNRVQVWTPNPIQNEAGQEVEDPQPIFNGLPASIENLAGDEATRGDQVLATCTHLVVTRFLITMETTPDLFLLVMREPPGAGASRRLDIVRTVDPDGTRRLLHHYCREAPLANPTEPPWQT